MNERTNEQTNKQINTLSQFLKRRTQGCGLGLEAVSRPVDPQIVTVQIHPADPLRRSAPHFVSCRLIAGATEERERAERERERERERDLFSFTFYRVLSCVTIIPVYGMSVALPFA